MSSQSSTPPDVLDLVDVAHGHREQAERLRVIAGRIDDQAAEVEREVARIRGITAPLHAGVIGGVELHNLAIRFAPGQGPIHYRELTRRIESAGYIVAGREPEATLLAQINRSTAFENEGRRSGLYRLREGAAPKRVGWNVDGRVEA